MTTNEPKTGMSTGVKLLLSALAVLLLVGLANQIQPSKSFCEQHPDGRGFTTLDEKYKWVKECNNGLPAPRR